MATATVSARAAIVRRARRRVSRTTTTALAVSGRGPALRGTDPAQLMATVSSVRATVPAPRRIARAAADIPGDRTAGPAANADVRVTDFTGKTGLVVGVANKRSIAWAIAQATAS